MRQRHVMTLGDEEATSPGVSVRVIRAVVVAAATLMTAAAVSVAGIVGWVGLLVPHFARPMVGPAFVRLLHTAVVLGAAYLLAVDTLARGIMARMSAAGPRAAARWPRRRACRCSTNRPPAWTSAISSACRSRCAVCDESGLAVVFSTHRPDQAFAVADRVALLHEGRLARFGPPVEIITPEMMREVYGVDVDMLPVGPDGMRVCVRHGLHRRR